MKISSLEEKFLTELILFIQCLHLCCAGVAQLARAPAFQAGCCGFESRRPLHTKIYNPRKWVLFLHYF